MITEAEAVMDAKVERKVDAATRTRVLAEIVSRNLLERKLLLTYTAISEHGPVTGVELDAMIGGQGPHGHVAALRYFGLVETVGRKVGNSGISSALIDVTDKVPEDRLDWKTYRLISGKGGSSKNKDSNKAEDDKVGRGVWNKIRKDLHAYFRAAYVGLNAFTVDRLTRSLDVDISILRDAAVNRTASATREVDMLSGRRELLEACDLLGITRPGVGRPLDLKKARRKMHELARVYHPDVNVNGAAMYRRIIEAFDVIETFTERS